MTEKIGLEAVMETDAFAKGMKEYTGGVQKATDETKVMGEAGKKMGEEQVSAGKQVKMAYTEISSAIGLAKQSYKVLEGAVDDTVGAFVTYAGQVREISQVTGQSAEAVSRVIQVTDDYKIKTESLNMVMKKMAAEGNKLSIDSLAKLSDKYLKLQPGVERTMFLTENFGRAGVDFAEIMLAGGKAIRAQSDAVSDGLILSDAALKKAREYELQQDSLNDSWMAAKIAVGQMVVPMLNTALGYQNAKLRADELGISLQTYVNGNTGLKSILPLEKTHAQLLYDITEAERVAAEKAAALQTQIEAEDGAFFRFIPTVDATTTALGYSTDQLEKMALSAVAFAVTGKLAEVFDGETTKLAALNVQLDAAVEKFGTNSTEANTLRVAMDDLKDATDEQIASMLYQQTAAGLDAAAQLDLALQLGILSQADYDVATAINNLTTQYDINGDGAITAGEGAKEYAAKIKLINDAIKYARDHNQTITQEFILDYIETHYVETVEGRRPPSGTPPVNGPPIITPQAMTAGGLSGKSFSFDWLSKEGGAYEKKLQDVIYMEDKLQGSEENLATVRERWAYGTQQIASAQREVEKYTNALGDAKYIGKDTTKARADLLQAQQNLKAMNYQWAEGTKQIDAATRGVDDLTSALAKAEKAAEDAASALKQDQAEFGFIVSFAERFQDSLEGVWAAEDELKLATKELNDAKGDAQNLWVSGTEAGNEYSEMLQKVTYDQIKLTQAETVLADARGNWAYGAAQIANAEQQVKNYANALEDARFISEGVAEAEVNLHQALLDRRIVLAHWGAGADQLKQAEEDVKNLTTTLEKDKTAATAAGVSFKEIGDGAKEIVDAQEKVDGLTDRLTELQVASQDAVNEMIAGFLQAQLAMDGVFSQEDIRKVLNYRLAVGLLTQEGLAAALAALQIAENLAGTSDIGGVIGGVFGKGYAAASGGDFFVTKPTLFLVGEAGPERAVFTPQGQNIGGADNSSALTVNIYGQTPVSVSDIIRAMDKQALLGRAN